MAGLSLYYEDSQDELEEFGFDEYSSDCDGIRITSFLDLANQDEMTPLSRLEKYAASDNVFNRQIVARGLLDVLRAFSDDEKDFLAVMETIVRLSEDTEPTVRAELMEQVPHLAMFLQENRPSFPTAFSKYLVPIVVRYLTDPNNQVRKTSQAALLVLLEQELIDRTDVEVKVCPVLLDLTAPDSDDDYKIEAVAIICKMASILTGEITERLLLFRFCELCSDGKLFHVRKVCATNFGDICNTVGQEATEKYLIPRFFQLCSDNVWGIRKACAECFMAVSCSVSPEVRRTKLSPLFINLISDPSRWVRQAAFQSLGPFISTFANPSSAGLYIKEDGTLSIRQLDNSCADVSSPARDSSEIQNLGTLQNPTSLRKVESSCGESLPQQGETSETDGNSQSSLNCGSHEGQVKISLSQPSDSTDPASISSNQAAMDHAEVKSKCTSTDDCLDVAITKETERICATSPPVNLELSGDLFNSFVYWRQPLPDINFDLELLQLVVKEEQRDQTVSSSLGSLTEGFTRSNELEKVLESLQAHLDDPDVQAQVQVITAALRAARLDSVAEEEPSSDAENTEIQAQPLPSSPELPVSPHSGCINTDTSLGLDSAAEIAAATTGHSIQCLESNENEQNMSLSNQPGCDAGSLELGGDDSLLFGEDQSKVQDVIPQPLLDQYLSMTDPSRAQTVDTEITKHCAYSLPGVALTLGRQNWHCLKNTYETLASDVQWKVRRTLAFSIHELAVILGDQLTAADLVPIFNGFLKDLDEVRIGVLKHLYDFLKLLHMDKRREYLYQLQEFMVTDNSRNWRFRYELAEQVILLLELYNPNDVHDYLRHIALSLCSDKVAEVRWISFKLVVEILRKFYATATDPLAVNLMNELTLRFCHCSKWIGRQAFAFICQAVVEEECMPVSQFVEHLLPSLLGLATDPVPNVRVLLAKALRHTLLEKAYFTEAENPHVEAVEEIVLILQSDRDRDVRFFASAELRNNPENTTSFIN
ncbi:serine/threonine-protein phosphatase 4 regulatory subunit 1 isoform X1 [Carcharodon carcharias]|uniref:serine/threonine-protein phosphatase 4 regulatory subunit 1 isoform X1 n=3 Tax=Carcharodon carcharias TaxID=13397 RepID=UPI001B7F532D|nr:serine/threonine-protein phosphatase 4 regulatory subunit 1 isoform X1 [Carcharodon carcharias]